MMALFDRQKYLTNNVLFVLTVRVSENKKYLGQ